MTTEELNEIPLDVAFLESVIQKGIETSVLLAETDTPDIRPCRASRLEKCKNDNPPKSSPADIAHDR